MYPVYAITSLGKEIANLSASRTFVRLFICACLVLSVSSPLGVLKGLWFVTVALPGLFLTLFVNPDMGDKFCDFPFAF